MYARFIEVNFVIVPEIQIHCFNLRAIRFPFNSQDSLPSDITIIQLGEVEFETSDVQITTLNTANPVWRKDILHQEEHDLRIAKIIQQI